MLNPLTVESLDSLDTPTPHYTKFVRHKALIHLHPYSVPSSLWATGRTAQSRMRPCLTVHHRLSFGDASSVLCLTKHPLSVRLQPLASRTKLRLREAQDTQRPVQGFRPAMHHWSVGGHAQCNSILSDPLVWRGCMEQHSLGTGESG